MYSPLYDPSASLDGNSELLKQPLMYDMEEEDDDIDDQYAALLGYKRSVDTPVHQRWKLHKFLSTLLQPAWLLSYFAAISSALAIFPSSSARSEVYDVKGIEQDHFAVPLIRRRRRKVENMATIVDRALFRIAIMTIFGTALLIAGIYAHA